MEFDDAKENIQPLSSGRNASILQASLQQDSPQELQLQRKQLEKEIHDYSGDDPLEPWYNYVGWIEQSCPSGGKESGLEEVLTKCLTRFENVERYHQDPRMVKLYNKFIVSHKSPIECYEQLYNAGIGTMVADFYISWAYYYDLVGNTRKADEIFKRGVACRAQPLDVLIEAQQHFGFIVAQRILYDNDHDTKQTVNQQLQDRRFALTSLRGLHKKSHVGSIRTGSAVKSFKPGTIQSASATSSRQSNKLIPIFTNENENPNAPSVPEEGSTELPGTSTKSVVRSIIEAARNQENQKEPGPWNKAHDKKKHKLFSKEAKAKDIGFSIHEDTNETKEEVIPLSKQDNNLPFLYPTNFYSKNKPQTIWETPVTTENAPDPCTFPKYNKCILYPRPNAEFQPEEWRTYKRFKRCGIKNQFVEYRDAVWSNDISSNMRRYPNFATKSAPQKLEALDNYFEPPKDDDNLNFFFKKYYNYDLQTEFQIEELLFINLQEARNSTNMKITDMEETVLTSSETVQRRKSFYPIRKSLAPVAFKQAESITSPTIAAKVELEPKLTNIEPPILSINKSKPSVEIVEVVEQEVNENKENHCAFAFEIYEDPTQSTQPVRRPANNEEFKFAQPNAVGMGSAYDADETCSTQVFTNFLRAQSVSTPKVPQKTASRMFGVVLKESPSNPFVEPVITEEQEIIATATVENEQGLMGTGAGGEAATSSATAASYSMLQAKQLSTILETSEHGTHTTNSGSTKSSINSPAFEMAETANMMNLPRFTELETVSERTCESSPGTTSNIPMLVNNGEPQTNHINDKTEQQITDKAELSITGKQLLPSTSVGQTPSGVRFLHAGFNDNNTAGMRPMHSLDAGNFTRLDDREDTVDNYMVVPVQFQIEKTETMSNILQGSHHGGGKFQDDKTETFSKMLLAPSAALSKFQDDKTGTIPFIPYNAPNDPINLDSFEIFADSPPKPQKFNIKKEILSPMQSFKKSQNSPGITGDNPKTNQTDDSFAAFLNHSIAPVEVLSKSTAAKSDNLPSLMREFSLIEDSQKKPFVNAMENQLKPNGSLFGRSLETRNESSIELFNKHLVEPPYKQSFLTAKSVKQNLSIDEHSERELIKSTNETHAEKSLISAEQQSKRQSKGILNTSKTKLDQSGAHSKNAFKPNTDSMHFIDESRPLETTNCSLVKVATDRNAIDLTNEKSESSSIYVEKTPKTPKMLKSTWEKNNFRTSMESSFDSFIHSEIDLNQTNQLIENICLDPNVNPFQSDLISAFLDQVNFVNYINQLPNCKMQHSVKRLQENHTITIHENKFQVQQRIGDGAYGVIYSGKNVTTGKRYAIKQEAPPNLWEFYICLEVRSRLAIDELLSAYTSINYALIGNNASIYFLEYSSYGSLIDVCNCVKKYTDKNIDEFIVLVLACEMLDIIDHLHALHIIHADVKADNFLLMRELSYPQKCYSLQLIDFGVSIDMELFQKDQHFSYSNHDNAFKCVEMREGRPWTYQLDLFGLAGTIHALLFGKYMEIEKRPNGIWMHKSYVPRYFNKDLWNDIFKTLLNVRSCNSLPNLQELRAQIKETLMEKEKIVKQKVDEFNKILLNTR